MVGIKGKAGRKRKFNDTFHKVMRKHMLEYYYQNRERRLARMHQYHKENAEIMKYAKKHNLSIPEARRILRSLKNKEEARP